MNESGESLIAFEGVTKRFGRRIALEDATFELREGQTLGIVGESGSGKSTAIRLAVGLERPSEGVVRWRGAAYPRRWGGLRRIRGAIGVVFQDPYDSMDPRMQIGRIVAEPLRFQGEHGDVSNRVREVLAAVGLPGAALDSYPGRYSGGGRQRIAIARALVLHPDVLLCDEPTASLDVSVQAQIMNLLLDLKASQRLASIFVSHDLDLVRRMADETIVMYAGRVLESGATELIASRPQHPYTAALLSAVPGDHPRRRKVAKQFERSELEEEVDRTGCVFAARCSRVKDVCRTTRPLLQGTEFGGRVACFFPLERETPDRAEAGAAPAQGSGE